MRIITISREFGSGGGEFGKRLADVLDGIAWGLGNSCHMTVNTSGRSVKELATAVADFARRWFERAK